MSITETLSPNESGCGEIVNHERKKTKSATHRLFENDKLVAKFDTDDKDDLKSKPYKVQYVWKNIIAMVVLHLAAFYGVLMLPYAKTVSIVFGYLIGVFGSIGVQAGAHRLWSHRSYKANFGVRILLAFGFTLALQNDIYEWCRDHRAHHKFSDTDGDPHNSSRGFFFSHVGWLMCKKHPEVKRRGRTIDLSDLKQDPIVMFQRKFYIPLVLLIWGFLPTFIPMYFWNENLVSALTGCVFIRYVITLNLTWLTNSWSHIYGYRPYNKEIAPTESSCRHLLLGEGFHNYHHSFPWDYSASELGAADVFNPATAIIDFFHYMGWAWDLKKVNTSLVNSKKMMSGDREFYHKQNTPLYEWVTGFVSASVPLLTLLACQQVGLLF